MPGYRALSSSVTGEAADHAREAETLRRDGDPDTAALLLESAIEAARSVRVEMPGWLCGRLAALYRTLGRYDDEVRLLEDYRDSQTSEDARARFDARLSKARTIAERKRRPDSGALTSVRKVLGTPRRRSGGARVPGGEPQLAHADISPSMRVALACALETLDGDRESRERFTDRLGAIASDARASGVPVERLVDALKAECGFDVTLGTADAGRAERYSSALLRLLAVYFDEADR